MTWIKRNLFFVVGSVVALVLMGLAGWFLYSKWQRNNEVLSNLNATYEKMKELSQKRPHPGNKKVDNVKLAKEQRLAVLDFSGKASKFFVPIPRVPDSPKVSDQEFSLALSRTVAQLQREATNASVMLPAGYNFSFEAQKNRISFAPGSPDRMAEQLGEVKAICDVLFQAKVNSLDGIRRERVSSDDYGVGQSDYTSERSVTNDLAIITSYDVTFRGFSSELAAVLAGFAASPHAIVVKGINIDPAPAAATPDIMTPVVSAYTYVQPQPQTDTGVNPSAASVEAAMTARYGRRGGGGGVIPGGIPLRERPTTPQVIYAPPVAASAAPRGPLPTVLDEKLLKITLNLAVIKLRPTPTK